MTDMEDETGTKDELSDLGRKLAAARRTGIPKTCPVCGREFLGMAKSIYDRHTCAAIASRRKRNLATHQHASNDKEE